MGLYNQQQWGQSQFFAGGTWSPRQPRNVLNIDAPRTAGLGSVVAPHVRTLICGIENNDTTDQRYIMRWRLAAGVGGARVSVDFDATRYTRVALPYEESRLSLLCDPYPTLGGDDVPEVDITAFAFTGDGFAEASLPGPMYSVSFALLAVANLRIPIPVGANRFRVVGVDDMTTPFRTTTMFVVRAGFSTRYALPGLGATPGMGDMFGIFNTDGFIPIASGATELDVQVSSGVSEGFVQFGLDL